LGVAQDVERSRRSLEKQTARARELLRISCFPTASGRLAPLTPRPLLPESNDLGPTIIAGGEPTNCSRSRLLPGMRLCHPGDAPNRLLERASGNLFGQRRHRNSPWGGPDRVPLRGASQLIGGTIGGRNGDVPGSRGDSGGLPD